MLIPCGNEFSHLDFCKEKDEKLNITGPWGNSV